MHLFELAFYTAGTLYSLFIDRRLVFFFLLVVALYLLISYLIPNAKQISTRRKIMLSTWTDPSEGVIIVHETVRADTIIKFLENIPKENRPTLTHVAIKAAGEIISEVKELNGRLAFGKFIPYESIDVSCLIDIEGGKDLAMICVKDIEHKGFKQIAQFIRKEAAGMKRDKGGAQHQKKISPLKKLPAFVVSIFVKIVSFVTNTLGIEIKSMGIEKHAFGAGCVTSLGMLNFKDATAPFSGFANCAFFMSLNAVHQAPVIEDGKIVIGKIINVNLVVDHRYIDGGRCKELCAKFHSVFNEPEKFFSIGSKKND